MLVRNKARYLTDINNISRNTGLYVVRYFFNVISDRTPLTEI